MWMSADNISSLAVSVDLLIILLSQISFKTFVVCLTLWISELNVNYLTVTSSSVWLKLLLHLPTTILASIIMLMSADINGTWSSDVGCGS